jgi:dGTPase
MTHSLHREGPLDLLEKDGRGLNLTWEVRDGIISTQSPAWTSSVRIGGRWGTLEGEVVKISDMVAYINHDIEDALRAGVIDRDDLPQSAVRVLGGSHSARVSATASP